MAFELLSISTVSRLNSHIDISEETKEQVKAYATKVSTFLIYLPKGFVLKIDYYRGDYSQ
jgi:LacI family transcriptional regulator